LVEVETREESRTDDRDDLSPKILEAWVASYPSLSNLVERAFRFAEEIEGQRDPDPILVYCLDRILTMHRFETSSFEVEIGEGMYGDEIGAVSSVFDEEILADVYGLVHMGNGDRVRYCLTRENEKVLDRLGGCDFEIREVPTKSIFIPNRYHVENLDQARVAAYRERETDLPQFSAEGRGDFPMGIIDFPQCLVDAEMTLVDGYHRFVAWGDSPIITVIAAKS
jgi:hypothetical protein